MEAIAEMVAALRCDYDRLEELAGRENDPLDDDERAELATLREAAGECENQEDAQQRIQEDPLSLRVRSGWVSLDEGMVPEEFELLLGTGGPASRIIGELDNGKPYNCRLEVQDWFRPWTEYRQSDHRDILDAYCHEFYFGD